MGRQAPQVVAGARTAENYVVAEPSTPDVMAPRKELPAGAVEYHSRATNYMVLLRLGRVVKDALGRETAERALKVQFRQGRAVVVDPEANLYLKGDPKKGIAPHGNYGLGKEFWDAQEAYEKAKKTQIEQAVDTIAENPEVVDRLMKKLGVEYKPARKPRKGPALAKSAPEAPAD